MYKKYSNSNKEKKSHIVFLILISIAVLGLFYYNSNSWSGFISGTLIAIVIPLSFFKIGITPKGISYTYKLLVGFATWEKIKEVRVS